MGKPSVRMIFYFVDYWYAVVRTGDMRGLLTLLAGGLNEVSVNERDSVRRNCRHCVILLHSQ
jgi:hypothetical protein